jgi:trimethylamine--corrinoid protein Co-methyltransferase
MDISRAVDALDNIHILHRPVQAHDTPESISQLHNLEAMIHNTVKPIQIGLVDDYTTKKAIEIASVMVGGKEELKNRSPLIIGSCPISPLQLHEEVCDVIIAVGEAGIPYNTISMVQPGATGPATLAGSITVFNAEMLAQNALLQLVNKGTPFIYGTSSCLMDMKLGLSAVGAPEAALGNAVGVELSKRYKLPCYLAGG